MLVNKHDQSFPFQDTIRGKFLGKLYLFNGLSKLRSNGDLPQKVLSDFDQTVVAGTNWDTDWPICLYDFHYKTKVQRHFVFKTRNKINIVEDHFGSKYGNIFDEESDEDSEVCFISKY